MERTGRNDVSWSVLWLGFFLHLLENVKIHGLLDVWLQQGYVRF